MTLFSLTLGNIIFPCRKFHIKFSYFISSKFYIWFPHLKYENSIFSLNGIRAMKYCYSNDVFFVRVQCFFLALYVSTILFVDFFWYHSKKYMCTHWIAAEVITKKILCKKSRTAQKQAWKQPLNRKAFWSVPGICGNVQFFFWFCWLTFWLGLQCLFLTFTLWKEHGT